MITDVTTYYLEMTDPSALRPKRVVHHGLEIKEAHMPSPAFNRFLYTAVGGDWYWIDRLPWTYQQWHDWVARPEGYPRKAGRFGVGRVLYGTKFTHEFSHPVEDRPIWNFGRKAA